MFSWKPYWRNRPVVEDEHRINTKKKQQKNYESIVENGQLMQMYRWKIRSAFFIVNSS